ncbi:MAG: carboxypeptidase M32 [Candidatus Hydrogenedentes bacterium]|nr:carboxypeptidase M32 [Candidatus Hydrogenedentota bacterium]
MTPDDAKLVSETLYDYERATKLPERFVETLAEEQSKAYEAWVRARKASDFNTFKPHLETLLGLLRQKAEYFGYEGSPYNALLEEYERGMTTEQLDQVFGELREAQSALVAQIMQAPQPDTAWTEGDWDVDAQWALTLDVLRDIGYDFDAGRQDRSVHPFTANFDIYDVRVTTRLNPRELFSALTGSVHEGGHALYEQGFLEKDRRTPLAQGISLGIHESQSRMWENMIGRSQAFWEHYTPRLQAAHAGKLEGITPRQVYQAVNQVAPSLIRVEADECTYNLHIILRYELERALIEGDLAVVDVPAAWNAKMKQYLGLEAPNDAQGCLQDIHWSHASMGYFPTYALGNLYAAQFFEVILRDLPDLWEQIRRGEFSGLLAWLRSHIHECGRRKTAVELIGSITGGAPSAQPFLRYLQRKYGELYRL